MVKDKQTDMAKSLFPQPLFDPLIQYEMLENRKRFGKRKNNM